MTKQEPQMMICPKATKEGGCIDFPNGTRKTCSPSSPHKHTPKCDKAEGECPACIPVEPEPTCPQGGKHEWISSPPRFCGKCGELELLADLQPEKPRQLTEFEFTELKRKIKEGYKWDCNTEEFNLCTKTHCYICPHVIERPPFWKAEQVPQMPLREQFEKIIASCSHRVTATYSPEKDFVDQLIEIATAHDQQVRKAEWRRIFSHMHITRKQLLGLPLDIRQDILKQQVDNYVQNMSDEEKLEDLRKLD